MDVEQFSPKAQTDNHFEKCDQEASREEMSTDSKETEYDVRVDHDTNVGSCRYICAHASKALRVRSSTTKDRHCKVNTPRGHRDRRVRLAVSTAIQLYNLQDRLGLHQPSKVLDWLMNKAKSAIDGLPRPSSLSNLKCRSCNTIQNNGTTVMDVVSTSRGADRISHSVPKTLAFSIEKDNKTGSRAALIEETRGRDLNVSATNVLCPSILKCKGKATAPGLICTESKRRQPSALQQKGNTQEGIAMTSPFQEQEGLRRTNTFREQSAQSGSFDLGFSFPDNINAILARFNSLGMPWHEEGARTDMHSRTPPLPSWERQFGTDPRAGSGTGIRLPFVPYSSHFDLSQDAGKANNFSQKCTTDHVSSVQDNDSIYVEEPLRLSGDIISYIESTAPKVTTNPLCEKIASRSTTGSTDGTEVQVNGGGNGHHLLNHQGILF